MSFTPNNIDAYKFLLGNGLRTNKFYVNIELPSFLQTKFPVETLEGFSVITHTINMPKPRAVAVQELEFMGEKINIATARDEKYDDIKISFRDTENMAHRRLIQSWLEGIQKTGDRYPGGGVEAPWDYKGKISITLMDGYWKPVMTAESIGVFPKDISSFTLTYDKADILSAEVTFSIDMCKYYTKPTTKVDYAGGYPPGFVTDASGVRSDSSSTQVGIVNQDSSGILIFTTSKNEVTI